MTDEWKQHILEEFAAWLDDLEEIPEPADAAAGNPPDLETLLREFTALRQEVRLQSRGNNRVGEQVERLAEQLSAELDSTRTVAATLRDDVPRARREGRERAITEFLDILEGVRRSAQAAESVSLPVLLLGRRARRRVRQALLKPLRLLESKATDCTRRLGLRETAALNQPFDSDTMRAVAATSTGRAPNAVTEIRRQGYTLDGNLLRVAEVCVEKEPKNHE